MSLMKVLIIIIPVNVPLSVFHLRPILAIFEFNARKIFIGPDGIVPAYLIKGHQPAEFAFGFIFVQGLQEWVVPGKSHSGMCRCKIGDIHSTRGTDAPAHIASFAVFVVMQLPV